MRLLAGDLADFQRHQSPFIDLLDWKHTSNTKFKFLNFIKRQMVWYFNNFDSVADYHILVPLMKDKHN